MEKLKIALPILVEGRYDKIKLESLLDAQIVETGGFSVFHRDDRIAFFRRLAAGRGIIVLTDSDGGGRMIRSYLAECLPKEKLFHLYIPAVPGKEKRKKRAGRAGLLGVEGTDAETLRRLFAPFAGEAPARRMKLTKADLYADGLSGGENSAALRAAFLRAADLPPDLPANALADAVNLLFSPEEYREILEKVRRERGGREGESPKNKCERAVAGASEKAAGEKEPAGE